ncbi:MAG: serine protease HtrA, partial [Clostridia bacterium]|nr:serine protease HtrA [Clostridia bacterium]
MKNRNEELKRKLKKAASISLCAVLAGGLAAGTYTGVNYLSGYEQSVQAAGKDQVELLKSEKKSDDSESKDDSKDSSSSKGSLDVSDIVEEAMPSIVSITTKSVEEVQNYY